MRALMFRARFKRTSNGAECWHKLHATMGFVGPTSIEGWKQISEWEQYTGLTDKNGVEIYEGDAIRIHHDDGDSNYGGIVEWIAEGDWLGWCLMVDDSPDMLRVEDTEKLEVFANIHERPELMEQS